MESSFPEPRELLAHAGWVRGLARALVGEDKADDLTQQTMLRALEKPPRFGGDPRPWLARVMRNLAWSESRAGGRRRRREGRVGSSAAAAEVPVTPDDLLARSEAHRLLVEDLLALEEPVRHLLILRYFEELTPAQIAHQLNLPAGTVRAQLSRGLERLRTRFRQRHGNDGFHSLILLAAPPAGAALSGASLTSTVWMMSTQAKVLSVLGLTAVAMLSLILVPKSDSPGSGGPAGEELSLAAVADDGDDLAPAASVSPGSGELQRLAALLPAGQAAPAVPAEDRIRVVGRCVDAVDGRPVPGCRVTLYGRNRSSTAEDYSWRLDLPVETNEQGHFQAEWPAKGDSLDLKIEAEEHGVRLAGWNRHERNLPKAGSTLDLGDIPMLRAWPLGGMVVDETGRPLEGLQIEVSHLPQTLPGLRSFTPQEGCLSDAEGSFAMGHPIPAGTFPLDIGRRGHRLLSPLQVTVPEGGLAEPLRVIARARPSVSGVCVDEEGKPMSRVYLVADLHPKYQDHGGSGKFSSAWTREDGSFRIYSVTEDDRAIILRLSGGDCEPMPGMVETAWGEQGIQYRVRRSLSFPLEVVDGETGEPVEDYRLACRPTGDRYYTASRSQREQHHPGGKAIVRGVWRGPNALRIFPKGGIYAEPRPVQFLAAEGELQPIRVELQRQRSLEFRVVDGEGLAVEGVELKIGRPGFHELTEQTSILPAENHSNRDAFGLPGQPSPPYPVLLGEGTTDGAGRVAIGVPPGEEQLVLRATKGPQAVILQAFPIPEYGMVEVKMSEGGVLLGRIRFWEDPGLMSDYSITLFREDGRPVGGGGRSSRMPLLLDGSFRVPGLEEGEYVVRLGMKVTTQGHGMSGGTTTLFNEPLGVVSIAENRPRKLEFDARFLEPGSIAGRVMIDGQPRSDLRVMFEVPWEGDITFSGGGGWFGQYVLEEDGSFFAEKLPPGRYRPILILGNFTDREGQKMPLTEIVEVPAGQTVPVVFDFPTRTLRVRVLDAVGFPLAAARCSLAGRIGFDYRESLVTDAHGWIEITPAPLFPVDIFLTGEAWVRLGQVQVDPELEVTELERQVPEQGSH